MKRTKSDTKGKSSDRSKVSPTLLEGVRTAGEGMRRWDFSRQLGSDVDIDAIEYRGEEITDMKWSIDALVAGRQYRTSGSDIYDIETTDFDLMDDLWRHVSAE